MKTRILLAVYLALLAASSVSGQTKTSGTLKCGKPEPRYSVEVGDRPGHVIVLEKTACTWTEPQVMGSDKTKDGYSVATVDITATRASGSGTPCARGGVSAASRAVSSRPCTRASVPCYWLASNLPRG